MERLLMFDYDGVIVDSFDYFYGAFIDACRMHGFEQIHNQETFLRLFETNMYVGLERAGIGRRQQPALLQTMGRNLAQRNGAYDLFPGMRKALSRLASANRVVIITSNLTGIVTRYLAQHEVRGVQAVLGSDRGSSKVNKIRRLMEKNPEAGAYYIGDTCGDMLEAREAGARSVAVTWGWHTAANLRKTSPDHIVQNPAEMADLFASRRAADGHG